MSCSLLSELKMNSSTQCRICLNLGAEITLFESEDGEEIVSKLFQCVNEQIEDKDGYPRHICTSCNKTLDIAYTFLQTYKESNSVLEEALQTTIDMQVECVEVIADNYFDFVVVKQESIEKEDPNVFENVNEVFFNPFRTMLNKESSNKIKIEPKTKTTKANKQNNIEMVKKSPQVRYSQEIHKADSTLEQSEDGNESDSTHMDEETIGIKFDNHTSETKDKKMENTISALCNICGGIFKSLVQLRIHKREAHLNKKYNKRKIEPKTDTKKENRKNKIDLFRNVQKLSSVLEQSKEGNKSDYEHEEIIVEEIIDIDNHNTSTTEHKKMKSKPSLLCDLCGNVFGTTDQLSTHRKQVHFKTTMQCPMCHKKPSSLPALNRHIKRMHNTAKKEFICSACGKAYNYISDLNGHFLSSHARHLIKKKRYPCAHCDKDFCTEKVKVMHERSVHTGERPAVCSVCESRFTHEDYLKEHMRLHTGETPFQCPICHRGYAQRCNMKSHIRHRHSVSELDEITLKLLKPNILKMLKP